MTRGRPTLYTAELAEAICARLAAGESLRAICRDDGMPDERTVRYWDKANVEGFSPHYAAARETGYLGLAEELLEIADDGRNDWMASQDGEGGEAWRLNGEHTTRSRMRLDTRKWILAKMLPKIYGDKVQHTDVSGTGPAEMVIKVFTGVPRNVADERD